MGLGKTRKQVGWPVSNPLQSDEKVLPICPCFLHQEEHSISKSTADHRNNFFKLIHQEIFQETILERWFLNTIAKYLPKGLKMKPQLNVWLHGQTLHLRK